MSLEAITQQFYQRIPISKQMGIRILEASSRCARVAVPLAPNINHVHTAFGGSLYAAAALSSYILFQEISREAGGLSDELVIQEGNIKYLTPVTGDFEIESTLVNDKNLGRFFKGLQRHRQARLKLRAAIFCNGLICAQFEGIYVFKGSHSDPT